MSRFSRHYNNGYCSKLGRAAKPDSAPTQQPAIPSKEAQRDSRPSQRDIARLNSAAMRHEKFMPNLAAELRCMASRGEYLIPNFY